MALVHGQPEAPSVLVLDIAATADLDVATTDMLTALHTDLREAGIELRLAQVRGSVRDRMRRTGLMATIGEDHCFLSDEAAMAAPGPVMEAGSDAAEASAATANGPAAEPD
jgi:SulP family sulfate permease